MIVLCFAAQVWLSAWNVLTVHCVAFIIQSAAFSAEHLESRVDAFIESCTQLLDSMPQQEFASQVRTTLAIVRFRGNPISPRSVMVHSLGCLLILLCLTLHHLYLIYIHATT